MNDEQPDLSQMNKDQLENYALAHFDVDIDKRNRIDDLRKEVQALIDNNGPELTEEGVQAAEESAYEQAAYLKNPKTGHVFHATRLLRARGDLVACDAKGKRI